MQTPQIPIGVKEAKKFKSSVLRSDREKKVARFLQVVIQLNRIIARNIDEITKDGKHFLFLPQQLKTSEFGAEILNVEYPEFFFEFSAGGGLTITSRK